MAKPYARSTKEFYEAEVTRYFRNTVSLANRDWISRFKARLATGSLVLDLGCGFGRDSRILREIGFRVLAVDFSLPMLALGKKWMKDGVFCCMDMMDLGLKAGSLGGIWCNSALVHVTKDDAVSIVNECAKVLQSGGVVYLGLNSGTGEGIEADERYSGAEKYYAYYGLREALSLLEGGGLRVAEVSESDGAGTVYSTHGMISIIAEKECKG